MQLGQPVAPVFQRRLVALHLQLLGLQGGHLIAPVIQRIRQRVLVLLLEIQNDRAPLRQVLVQPGHFLREKIQRLARHRRAQRHVFLQDQRHEFIGHQRRHVGIGGLERHRDQRGLGRGPVVQGRAGRQDLGALAHVVDNVIGRHHGGGLAGPWGIDLQPVGQFQQIGPRHDALLDDLQLFGGRGAHGRGRHAVGDLFGFNQQIGLGHIDRRQHRGEREAKRRAHGQDQQEIGQAAQEQGQVEFHDQARSVGVWALGVCRAAGVCRSAVRLAGRWLWDFEVPCRGAALASI